MKNKIKYTEEPMGELRVIEDFLPPPDQLVLKEDNVKVTIAFKREMLKVAELEMERLPFLYYGTKKELAEQKTKPVVI